VGLAGLLLGVPPAGHALEPVAHGHTNYVDHLILGRHLQLESPAQIDPGKVDLVSNGYTIELDLHDVNLLLPAPENLHLCAR